MKKHLLLTIFNLAILTVAIAQTNYIQTGRAEDTPLSKRISNRYFGSSVAMSAGRVIIGSTGISLKKANVNDPNYAPVYIYEVNAYGKFVNPQSLVSNTTSGLSNIGFGQSVAIENDIAVVGAAFDDFGNGSVERGSVYVYRRNNLGNWLFSQKLIASDGLNYDMFGYQVAITNGKILVTSYVTGNSSTRIPKVGLVYVYKDDGSGTFVENQTFQGNMNAQYFGEKMKSAADLLVVSGQGFYYIYKTDNLGFYQLSQTIGEISSSEEITKYAYEFSLSEDNLLLSSIDFDYDNFDNQNSYVNQAGAAYIFTKNINGQFIQTQKIVANDRANQQKFGWSSMVSGNKIFVSAKDSDNLNNLISSSSGSVYIYEKSAGGIWTQTQKIFSHDRRTSDYFGTAMVYENGMLIVAAPWSETKDLYYPITRTGSVYSFIDMPEPLLPENNTSGEVFVGVSDQSTIRNAENLPILALGTYGATPLRGNKTVAKIWKESNALNDNGIIYLPRHYEITPTTDVNTSTATVTLYFSQQEFLDFNSNPAKTADFPVGPADAQGIANIRITKIGGSSANGTGLMYSYIGARTVINPDDDKIVWNNAASRWEVTFNVTGFSGFFASTTPTMLPLTLVSFNGKKDNRVNQLIWNTISEINTAHFVVERSASADIDFIKVAEVSANGSGANRYSFADRSATIMSEYNYYRLKMVDRDGVFTYSKVIAIKNNQLTDTKVQLYPNPAKDFVNLSISDKTLLKTELKVLDLNGKMMLRQKIVSDQQVINISKLPNGMYVLSFENGENVKLIKQ